MMRKTTILSATTIILTLILAACGTTITETPKQDLPEAIVAARQKLSKELEISAENIELVSFSEQEWPDACLGIPASDEMCAQVITPGYEVTFKADGQEYVYRTDEDGKIIQEEK